MHIKRTNTRSVRSCCCVARPSEPQCTGARDTLTRAQVRRFAICQRRRVLFDYGVWFVASCIVVKCVLVVACSILQYTMFNTYLKRKSACMTRVRASHNTRRRRFVDGVWVKTTYYSRQLTAANATEFGGLYKDYMRFFIRGMMSD